ncbi:MAG TPA: ribonuclease P protein component [Chloroflexota bacterium]
MKREQRLRTVADFARVRDAARRGWPHRLLVVYAAPNDLPYARVGITVSGRVGKAVVRNKVRRRLREALRARLARITAGLDVLVIARPASASATWQELNQALDALLERAGATRPATETASACV